MLGRLDDLVWLHANRPERCSRRVLSQVVGCGHVHIIKWLVENYASGVLNDPVRGCSDLEMAKWPFSEYSWQEEAARIVWISSAIEATAGAHAIDLVKFLYSIGPEASARMALSIAARRGDLEMVKLLDNRKAKKTKKAGYGECDCQWAFGGRRVAVCQSVRAISVFMYSYRCQEWAVSNHEMADRQPNRARRRKGRGLWPNVWPSCSRLSGSLKLILDRCLSV